uniref:Uncharacterized protein n=1 Tax=Populus trichocarpa TaxID=3694 RepID=U7E2M1_POPTR
METIIPTKSPNNGPLTKIFFSFSSSSYNFWKAVPDMYGNTGQDFISAGNREQEVILEIRVKVQEKAFRKITAFSNILSSTYIKHGRQQCYEKGNGFHSASHLRREEENTDILVPFAGLVTVENNSLMIERLHTLNETISGQELSMPTMDCNKK